MGLEGEAIASLLRRHPQVAQALVDAFNKQRMEHNVHLAAFGVDQVEPRPLTPDLLIQRCRKVGGQVFQELFAMLDKDHVEINAAILRLGAEAEAEAQAKADLPTEAKA